MEQVLKDKYLNVVPKNNVYGENGKGLNSFLPGSLFRINSWNTRSQTEDVDGTGVFDSILSCKIHLYQVNKSIDPVYFSKIENIADFESDPNPIPSDLTLTKLGVVQIDTKFDYNNNTNSRIIESSQDLSSPINTTAEGSLTSESTAKIIGILEIPFFNNDPVVYGSYPYNQEGINGIGTEGGPEQLLLIPDCRIATPGMSQAKQDRAQIIISKPTVDLLFSINRFKIELFETNPYIGNQYTGGTSGSAIVKAADITNPDITFTSLPDDMKYPKVILGKMLAIYQSHSTSARIKGGLGFNSNTGETLYYNPDVGLFDPEDEVKRGDNVATAENGAFKTNLGIMNGNVLNLLDGLVQSVNNGFSVAVPDPDPSKIINIPCENQDDPWDGWSWSNIGTRTSGSSSTTTTIHSDVTIPQEILDRTENSKLTFKIKATTTSGNRTYKVQFYFADTDQNYIAGPFYLEPGRTDIQEFSIELTPEQIAKINDGTLVMWKRRYTRQYTYPQVYSIDLVFDKVVNKYTASDMKNPKRFMLNTIAESFFGVKKQYRLLNELFVQNLKTLPGWESVTEDEIKKTLILAQKMNFGTEIQRDFNYPTVTNGVPDSIENIDTTGKENQLRTEIKPEGTSFIFPDLKKGLIQFKKFMKPENRTDGVSLPGKYDPNKLYLVIPKEFNQSEMYLYGNPIESEYKGNNTANFIPVIKPESLINYMEDNLITLSETDYQYTIPYTALEMSKSTDQANENLNQSIQDAKLTWSELDTSSELRGLRINLATPIIF